MSNKPSGNASPLSAYRHSIRGFYSLTNGSQQTLLYTFFLIIVTLASFWRVVTFDFWKDDWFIIWTSLYTHSSYYNHPGTPVEFFILSRIFGLHADYWMLLGIVLRIAVSYFVYAFIF